jgi:hypothetical protein
MRKSKFSLTAMLLLLKPAIFQMIYVIKPIDHPDIVSNHDYSLFIFHCNRSRFGIEGDPGCLRQSERSYPKTIGNSLILAFLLAVDFEPVSYTWFVDKESWPRRVGFELMSKLGHIDPQILGLMFVRRSPCLF